MIGISHDEAKSTVPAALTSKTGCWSFRFSRLFPGIAPYVLRHSTIHNSSRMHILAVTPILVKLVRSRFSTDLRSLVPFSPICVCLQETVQSYAPLQSLMRDDTSHAILHPTYDLSFTNYPNPTLLLAGYCVSSSPLFPLVNSLAYCVQLLSHCRFIHFLSPHSCEEKFCLA